MTSSRERLERLGEAILRWRFAVVLVVLGVTALFAFQAAQLRMLTRFDELLPTSHPFLEVHREYADTFGGANTILILLEVTDGDIFNLDTLNRIFRMTHEIDRIYGVNHYQIESIAHRTNRTLRVGAGGLIEMQPVMEQGPQTPEDVDRIRRIVFSSQNLYGVLVSLDAKAALIRASFIEGRLDHRRLFQDVQQRLVEPFSDERHRIHVAGEPQLYGWIYSYASEAWWILGATTLLAWILLRAYFHDWRGALRPTLSAVVAALWGLGFIHWIGFSLDPLALVIPFFITARAVSHSAQMHERYYEELRATGGERRKAILRAFAGLFVPTLSGILTDALGILAILLVPIPFLQKLAVTASFWIAAIAVSELLLNPIVYSVLAPPSPAVLARRAQGFVQNTANRCAEWLVRPSSRRVVLAVWLIVLGASSFFWTQLVVGDPEAATPLLDRDSPYNQAHQRIQERFGGVEPLIIVVEGDLPGALTIPANVRTIEEFQRFLERDPAVGASFSYVDILTTMAVAFNEKEPKWGVIPSSRRMVSVLFSSFFMGTSYEETARFMDPDFTRTAVFFYAKDHKGETVRRLIDRSREFIDSNPLEGARFRLAGGLIGVLAAANRELVRNDILLNVIGFTTVFVIVALTYRSLVAGLFLITPLLVTNGLVNAMMGAQGIGLNVQALPVITVGIGFGIDFAFYLVSRIREELLHSDTPEDAARKALSSAGKAVAFTAVTMVAGTLFWTLSDIRFNAEMGLLLAVWMLVAFLANATLLPTLLLWLRPRFLLARRRTAMPLDNPP